MTAEEVIPRISVDEDSCQVWLGDQELCVGGVPFRLLALLVRNAGVIVSRRTIAQQVWGHRTVSDNNINMQVVHLRRALNDSGDDPTYIRTVRGQGFTVPRNRVAHRPGSRPGTLHLEYAGQSRIITLGGQDIVPLIKDLTIRLESDRAPVVTVGLAVEDAFLDFTSPRVVLPPKVAALLVQLGWSPPPDPPEPPQHE